MAKKPPEGGSYLNFSPPSLASFSKPHVAMLDVAMLLRSLYCLSSALTLLDPASVTEDVLPPPPLEVDVWALAVNAIALA